MVFYRLYALKSADLGDRKEKALLLGNYRIIREIGRGGLGTVYLGEHIVLGKSVALKILHERRTRDGEACQRFLAEARMLAQLRHPHIVEVMDYGQDDQGHIYYVMELLKGQSLADILADCGALPLLRTLTILHQLTQALQATHCLGVIHRDLKPGNVFVERYPTRGGLVLVVADQAGQPHYEFPSKRLCDYAKVLDFGIAKFRDFDDDPEIVLGTPLYMAPEQIRNEPVDVRTDVYGLGVLSFEMLTGKPPFDGATGDEVTRKHLQDPPPVPHLVRTNLDIPAVVEAMVLRALSKDPARRQQSMEEFDLELCACLAALPLRVPTR